jgi:hypothetical protein
LLRSLAAKELNEELSVFHRSHRHKFLRHHGGDYPHELACVHAQYVGLVSRHVELALRSAGTSWEAACEACRRAPADGRCSALRLRLLQHLVALEDFPAFFELMLSTQLPGAEAPVAVVNTDREGMNTDHEGSAEGTRGSEAVPDCMGSEVGDELASTVQPYTADVQSGPRSSCASTMRATAAAADAAWVDSPIASFAPSLANTLPSGGAAVVDSGGVSFLSSYAGSAVVGGTYGYVDGAHTSHTYESDSGVSCASSAMRAPMSPVWIEGTVRLADDTTLHTATADDEAVALAEAVRPFCSAMGSALNIAKCEGLTLGAHPPLEGIHAGTGISFRGAADAIRHLGILLTKGNRDAAARESQRAFWACR